MPRQTKHIGRSRNSKVHSIGLDTATLVNPRDDKSFQWDGNTQGLLGIAHGSAGMIFELDDYQVVNVYLGQGSRRLENFEIERQAHRNLQLWGHSEHVLKCFDIENPYGRVLERCCQTVRQRIQSPDYSPCREALLFAFQAAKELAFVHRHGIKQGDVGCHNMLLDGNRVLKIADFAGSLVDECKFVSTVDYEVGSRLPGAGEPTQQSNIFALGSSMYEMITCRKPYEGLPDVEVQRRFKQGKFLDDFGELFRLGRIIEKCWGKSGGIMTVLSKCLTILTQHTSTDSNAYPDSLLVHSISFETDRSSSTDSFLEARRSTTRRRHPDQTKYVNSYIHRKDSKRSRGHKGIVDHNREKKQRAHRHTDGRIDHIVYMF